MGYDLWGYPMVWILIFPDEISGNFLGADFNRNEGPTYKDITDANDFEIIRPTFETSDNKKGPWLVPWPFEKK